MLGNEKIFSNNKIGMGCKKLNSKQNIHKLGVNYICNFLDSAGFTIHEVNENPNHHFQLLAKVNDKSLLIAVRTASFPDIGSIDTRTKKRLIKEAEQLNAVPHFAGLTIKPSGINAIEADGLAERQNYNVIFSGISVVHKPE